MKDDLRQPAMDDIVFLVDCDNTLMDNDRVQQDLREHMEKEFGVEARDRYWAIFESLRNELGYADYLGALQRYRLDAMNEPRLLLTAGWLMNYRFADRLYPQALEVIAHLNRLGPTVIVTDGDVVFQPRKVRRSGLWDAVDGRVMIFVHKELMLDVIERAHPAQRYVLVDDKQRLLAAMKDQLGQRLFTVFPRQGHYALDPANIARYPTADLSVDRIADLLDVDFAPKLGIKETP